MHIFWRTFNCSCSDFNCNYINRKSIYGKKYFSPLKKKKLDLIERTDAIFGNSDPKLQ